MDKGGILPCEGDGLPDSSGCRNVVVLQHYSVREVEPVIIPSSHPYRIFFEYPVVWSCFSGVKQPDPAALKHISYLSRMGGYPAHPLNKVQGSPFAGKYRPYVTLDLSCDITVFHCISVFEMKADLYSVIQKLEYALKDMEARYHAILLTDQLYPAFCVLFYYGVCSDVLMRYVFAKCRQYEAVNVVLHPSLPF